MNLTSTLNLTAQEDKHCNWVHSLNASERCDFVQSTESCAVDEGLFNYTTFVYCAFRPHLVPLAVVILIIWWLMLFVAIAICADNFFCPSLVVIGKTLRMTDNIAGVTLLALGNGAPDVFSAYSGVRNMKEGDVGLVFGALLGAGVFLTTVVVGCVSMVGAFQAMQRPFLRDLIFYIVTVFMTFVICYDRQITLYESIGYLIAYAVYVFIVVVGRFINQYYRSRTAHTAVINQTDSVSNESETESDGDEEGENCSERDGRHIYNYGAVAVQSSAAATTAADAFDRNLDVLASNSAGETDPLLSVRRDTVLTSGWREFLLAVSPFDVSEWRESGPFNRFYMIFKLPALFLIKITVPLVDYDCPRNNWNKHLAILHCIVTPVFTVVAADPASVAVAIGNSHILPCYIGLLIGCIAAIIVWFTSRRDQPPVYHAVFAYVGFMAAVMWIKNIANEIVNLLQTGGVVFSISVTILGLTFLAWGNSIPDLVADVAMAKRGFPRTGISACFGGPLFNTLLGIGVPFTLKTALTGIPVHIKFKADMLILFIGLAASLISTLVIVPLILKFWFNRKYASFLLLLYGTFLVVAILIEANVIVWKIGG